MYVYLYMYRVIHREKGPKNSNYFYVLLLTVFQLLKVFLTKQLPLRHLVEGRTEQMLGAGNLNLQPMIKSDAVVTVYVAN